MLNHDEKLEKEFELLLSTFPNNYFCEGITDLPQVIIPDIDESTEIKYPIDNETLNKIKASTQKSKFGRGTQTIYDSNTRNSFELNNNQFKLKKFETDSRNSSLLETIRKSLMPHIDFIIAEPYKLIIYEKGCFFNKHKDHKSTPLHFGSLILLLPYKNGYKNGDFVLEKQNNKEIKKFIWKLNTEKFREIYIKNNQCQYISFYTDINHEIKKITEGVRISIVFQLFINEEFFYNFNKYNWIALQNLYKYPPKSKKEYLQIKIHKKTGLQKIKKIRGLQINNNEHNVNVYNVLIENFKFLNEDICRIIAEYLYFDFLKQMVDIIHNWDYNKKFKLKYVQFEEERRYNYYNGISFLIVFEYEYSGNIIHPLLLKGRDIFIYQYFQKYLFVYPLTLSIHLNKMQYAPYNDGDNSENNIECEPRLELGNRYVSEPDFIGRMDDSGAYMLYVGDKDETLANLKFKGYGKETDLGNEGVYQEWDVYHICGLLMRPYFPIESDDSFTTEYYKIH